MVSGKFVKVSVNCLHFKVPMDIDSPLVLKLPVTRQICYAHVVACTCIKFMVNGTIFSLL